MRLPAWCLRRREGARRTRAQAMVELALILPIFLFMVMGALQLSLIAIVWIGLQGITQDTARWMASSSPAPLPTVGNCSPSGSNANWPRPRWANGNDGTGYRDCYLPPLVQSANFTAWTWNPSCASGADCWGAGTRRADGMLRLTATYDWSNVLILPVINGGGTVGYAFPTTFTVTAAGVMQY